jgi:hypothetical protein
VLGERKCETCARNPLSAQVFVQRGIEHPPLPRLVRYERTDVLWYSLVNPTTRPPSCNLTHLCRGAGHPN